MKGVVSVLVSISFLMAICPAVTADLLPGWTMYFIDFDPGQDLDLKVTQRSPDLEEPHPEEPGEFSDFRSATGVGCFAAGGMSGTLFVTQAKWSNTSYNTSPYGVPYIKSDFPDSGFPESAIATGSARLGFFNWKPFMVELLSYEWPDYPNILDVAILHINGDSPSSIIFTGQLHHSRLRAWFAPPRSDSRRTLATTWGKVKNSR